MAANVLSARSARLAWLQVPVKTFKHFDPPPLQHLKRRKILPFQSLKQIL